MRVRNITDKKLRMRLADMDYESDSQTLYELAREVSGSDGEDPIGDAIKILKHIIDEDPDNAGARDLLRRLKE